jgi:hypothetical protein
MNQGVDEFLPFSCGSAARNYRENAYQTYIGESVTCDDLAILEAAAFVKAVARITGSFQKLFRQSLS